MIYRETGQFVVEEYFLNVLLRTAYISMSNPESVTIVTASGNTRAAGTTMISLSDYVITSTTQPSVPEGNTFLGNITYYGNKNGTYQYYGAQCSYRVLSEGESTYTINGNLLCILEMIGVLIGCCMAGIALLTESAAAAATIIKGSTFGASLGSLVEDLAEKSVLGLAFPQLACHRTRYEIAFSDRANTDNDGILFGTEYMITEAGSSYQGNVYTEGYTPDDWGSSFLAIDIHSCLFPYARNYSVYSW